MIGQYGKSEDGEKPAFKDEEDVPNDSKCATFCAVIAHIGNERWNGVPFVLKAGKGKSARDRHSFIHSFLSSFLPCSNHFHSPQRVQD